MRRSTAVLKLVIWLGVITQFCISRVLAQSTQSYAVQVPAGFVLIANQLDHGSNTLNEILPDVPDGCIIYKYVNSNGVWLAAYFDRATGAWLPRNFTLSPGEGAFLESPKAFTATFNGNPHIPATASIPNGKCYLVSRQTNALATYQQIVGKQPVDGSQVFRWLGSSYEGSTYDAVYGWDFPFSIQTGESVWIAPSGGLPATFPTNLFGPVMAATRNGSNVRVEWRGGGVLQQSGDFTNWTDVPSAVSPYSASAADAPARFFRVRR